MTSLKNVFTIILVSALSCSTFLFAPDDLWAQSPVQELGGADEDGTHDLVVTKNLKERVDFWIMVFTQYGKNQLVFHHREHPHIIYSVLDFSELAERYGASAEFERKKRIEIELETARIQRVLLNLAEGKTPDSPLERRLERLFKDLTRWGWRVRSLYREAATIESLRTQTGIKEKFREGLIRSRRYMHAIEAIFSEAGLPLELSRMPHIESSFDYSAYSSVGAAGIWQFMRNTGRGYMRVDHLVDERRDPITASRGAAHYLGHAYRQTGSWPLAVTSYNHGLTGIKRAARESGTKDISVIIRRYKGSSFGFASKNFYPELLAAIEVDNNWQTYFPGTRLDAPVYFDEVIIGAPVNVDRLAKAAGVSRDRIIEMNPSFLPPVSSGRMAIPPDVHTKVPHGKGAHVASQLPGARLAVLTQLPVLRKVVVERKVTKKVYKQSTPSKSQQSAPKKVVKKKASPTKKPTTKKSPAAETKTKKISEEKKSVIKKD